MEESESRKRTGSLKWLKIGRSVVVFAFAFFLIAFFADPNTARGSNWEVLLPVTISAFIIIILILQLAIESKKGAGIGSMGAISNKNPEKTLESIEAIQNGVRDISEYVPEEYLSGSEIEARIVQALEKPTGRALCPVCKKIVDIKDGTCLECGEPVVEENAD